MQGPPHPDSSCKDSVRRGAELLSPNGEAATLVERPPCRDACSSSSDSSSPLPRRLAQDATIVSRDVPLAGARTLAVGAALTARFDLVGVALARHRHGRSSALARRRGRWSAWAGRGARGGGRGPDGSTVERDGTARLAARQSVVGRAVRSDRVPHARPRHPRQRAWFVAQPRRRRAAARALQKAACARDRPALGLEGGREDPPRRAVVRRRRCASRSSTTPPARTATRRPRHPRSCAAIQLYHVKGNGWNDIGYNFLVDRFGTVYEGRYGGIERNVVGAQAEGFNTGSVGVARARRVQLAGDRRAGAQLARARCSPGGSTSRTSIPPRRSRSSRAATPATRAGLPVFLRTVSGHRDTGFTDCPGDGALQPAQRRSRARSRGSGCRSSTRPRSAAPSPARCASAPSCRRRCPGRSTSTTRRATRSRPRPAPAPTSTGRGTRRRLPPGSYSYAIRSDQSVTPAGGRDRRRATSRSRSPGSRPIRRRSRRTATRSRTARRSPTR